MIPPLPLPGRYRHYKGKEYEVLMTAYRAGNLDAIVVYQALYTDPELGDKPIFWRPLEEFTQTVEHEGKHVPRFLFLKAKK